MEEIIGLQPTGRRRTSMSLMALKPVEALDAEGGKVEVGQPAHDDAGWRDWRQGSGKVCRSAHPRGATRHLQSHNHKSSKKSGQRIKRKIATDKDKPFGRAARGPGTRRFRRVRCDAWPKRRALFTLSFERVRDDGDRWSARETRSYVIVKRPSHAM